MTLFDPRHHAAPRWLALAPCLLAAACGSTAASTTTGAASGAGGNATTTSGTTTTGASGTGGTTAGTDLTKLPIGDGKYGSSPKVGYIFSCQTSFTGGPGGASKEGPWIDDDAGTFDFTTKVVVQGAVAWPTNTFSATLSGSTRQITGNALPSHTTGVFPIASTDPAYAYDQNPNSIKAQTLSWALPAIPTVAATPTCLPGGPIGVMLTGALFFDALDGEGRDALAHELQDACQAHPEPSGEYHYHSRTTCQTDPGSGHSALLGYARDGFGIYGVRGESGETLTDADLDECHGHTHSITWDGATVTLYHYHQTYEYPYTLGCFKGTPVN
jgi:hypothetical protein